MTATELQDLIVTRLVKGRGGTQRRWRLALGSIRVRDTLHYPHCNWTAEPSGTAHEVAAIEDLLDEIRLAHPIVRA